MKYFWTTQDSIPTGVGFGQFGAGHWVWLGITALLILWITFLYKGQGHARRIRTRRVIALLLVAIEASKQIMLARDAATVMAKTLPLHVCSFAAYAIIFEALFPEKDTFSEMLALLFLPGAFMAILFPTTAMLPALNIFCFYQFAFHGLIIAYAVARFASGEIRIRYAGLWKSVAQLGVLAIAVYIVDRIFGLNYMFLRETEGNPMLELIWNAAGKGRFYVLGLVVFVIFVMHIFFLLFKVLERTLVRKDRCQTEKA